VLLPVSLMLALLPAASAATFTVTTKSLPDGVDGVAFSAQLASINGTGTVTWKLVSASTLVTGLHLSTAGLVSGTATASTNGAGSFYVEATDSATPTAHTATATIAYVMNPENGTFRITTTQFPNATVGVTYSSSIKSSGGVGTVTFKLINSTRLPAGLALAASGAISGKPTAATGKIFEVQATDSSTPTAKTVIAYLNILVKYPPLTFNASVPSGTVGVPYGASFNAMGGDPGYTWTMNGIAVPASGAQVAVSDNLNAFQCSGDNLCIGGSPTSPATISVKVKVKDAAGDITGPITYTITITNSQGGQVTGKIDNLDNWCGNGVVPEYPPIKVTINTTPAMTTTADIHSGNYSFSNVPQGTFTVTPSISIAGASSVFYPATHTVTLSGGHGNTVAGFTFVVGYTVSGTAAYNGSKTGRVYLTLNGNCGTTPGVSIPAKGAFTIRGVGPGDYTLTASMDNLGYGQPNAANPAGSSSVTLTTTGNLTGGNVALVDPGAITLSSAPQIQTVNGFNGGAITLFNPIQNNNSVEQATSYKLEWSTTKVFTAVTGSKTFPATGTNGSNVWLMDGLTNGAIYYFRAEGMAGASTSPWSNVVGPVTIGALTAGNAVSGTVTFTGTATGPLYTGFYNGNTGKVYVTTYPHPVSPQVYSVQVPSGSGYVQIGIIDQNNNGVIVPGDIQDTNGNNKMTVTISGPTANDDLTLPSTATTANLTTSQYKQVNQNGSANGYDLNFSLKEQIKLPVDVTLLSGPNALAPADLGQCSDCGGNGFDFYLSANSDTPKVGDTYSLLVTFSDGTTATMPAAVTVVPGFFATNLAPTGSGTSTTPTFIWTDPAGASSYLYSFTIWDSNGNQVWAVPSNGNDSNSKGFSGSITSIKWGTDPTGANNPPTVSSLTAGEEYQWQISVTDSNGNSTQQQVAYKP